MTRLPYFATQSINWYDRLTRVINPFSFSYSLFSGENCISSVIRQKGESQKKTHQKFIETVCLLLVYSNFIAWSFQLHQLHRYIFWRRKFHSKSLFILLLHGASINFLFWTTFLFFVRKTFLTYQLNFCFDPSIFCHLLADLFPSFSQFIRKQRHGKWEKRKKEKVTAKLFALHANAITSFRTILFKRINIATWIWTFERLTPFQEL